METLELEGRWTLHGVAEPLSAVVPGHVHADLLTHGLVPNVYETGDDEAVRWVDRQDWRYSRRFELPAQILSKSRLELVFEGLDTFAEIAIDGEPVGSASNMFRPHRFDVSHLSAGEHELSVTFRSAVEMAEREQERLGALPYLNAIAPFNFVRKMACSFGWDWGPALPGCGIFDRVYLWAGDVRIDAVRPQLLEIDDRRALLRVHVDGDDGVRRATLAFEEDVIAQASGDGPLELEVPNPQRWWPRSHGSQPLYTLTCELGEARQTVTTGLRTVELDTSKDDLGRKFTLVVNDEPVFCRGANVIPDDCSPHEARYPAHIWQTLEQAVAANMNCIRVWGGGLYGSDALYGQCDKLGLLVWQDFPFACAAYPEAEPLRSEIEAEARHAVARITGHASLALWGGCNENVWGVADWGFADGDGPGWGHEYYFDLLPRICAELDPTTPYWPASPWSGDDETHPNEPEHGNSHVWQPWEAQTHPVFEKRIVRFCSEGGFQGPPPRGALKKQFDLDDDWLKRRQRSERADGELRRIAAEFFGELSGNDLHHALQIIQARLLTRSMLWLRANWPQSAGAIYWQLNDTWPAAMSWSAVDGEGRQKPLWYATRRFFADRALAFVPNGLVAINDHAEPWTIDGRLRRVTFDGDCQSDARLRATVAPRTVQTLAPMQSPDDPGFELLYAEVGELYAHHFFEADHNLRYPPPQYWLRKEAGDLVLHAHSLLRDVVIHVDALDPDASLSDQMLTLLPGQSVRLRPSVDLEADALRSVVACANTLGR